MEGSDSAQVISWIGSQGLFGNLFAGQRGMGSVDLNCLVEGTVLARLETLIKEVEQFDDQKRAKRSKVTSGQMFSSGLIVEILKCAGRKEFQRL